MSNIRDLYMFKEGIWDWTELNSCFAPTKIKVTDADGLVERRGHFLLLEGKKMDIEIPLGQKILFEALSKVPKFTILMFWGNPPKDIRAFESWGELPYPLTSCTIEEFKQFIKQWFKKANIIYVPEEIH